MNRENKVVWLTSPPEFKTVKTRNTLVKRSFLSESPLVVNTNKKSRNLDLILEKKEKLYKSLHTTHSINTQDQDEFKDEQDLDQLLLSMDVDIETVKFNRILVQELKIREAEKEIVGVLRGKKVVLSVREDWLELEFKEGEYIHVTGVVKDFTSIGNESGHLIITCPDLLLSVTNVAEGFECMRRAFLSSRVKGNTTSRVMVYGKMLHELFQMSLKTGDFSQSKIKQNLDFIIANSTLELYSIGEHEDKVQKSLGENVARLESWGKVYYGPKATSFSVMEKNAGEDFPSFSSVKSVVDIEDRIWSPTYGLKGYIDATTVINYDYDGVNSDLLVPLEFKTGKNMSISHEAQTGLYSLMVSDKYGIDCSAGILYYLLGSKMKMITKNIHHIRALIIGRNALANYIKSANQLPPMLSHRKVICQRCYALDACLFYHKAFEDGTVNTVSQSGLKIEFEEKTKDLTDTHIQFFKKWDSLISLEEGDDVSFRREIWAFESEEREKLGRCFSNMKILESQQASAAKSIGQFSYTFVRSECTNDFKSFLNSSIKERDPIVISSESGQVGLAVGYVTSISATSVGVEVDKPIIGAVDLQRFFPNASNAQSARYRIDKDQLSGGSGIGRSNLINLFIDPKSAKLRELIVDLKTPYFSSAKVDIQDSRLNLDQKSAISKVLSARDYAIILGMPGTGKTFTISQIVKELISRKKSVLLTSYTHSAVDNILLKLIDEKIDFCRIGNQQRIHPRIVPFTAESQNIQTVSEMESFYESRWVVATTCLALNHVIFSKRRFDYCIVDEASQLTLPHCIGPLQYANTFVLVGDHYQLSPLVRNAEALKGGMAESLFKTLSEAHPQSVIDLRYQYRMNSDIMNLSNTLIYGNRLICANQTVSESSFSCCHSSGSTKMIQGPLSERILSKIIDPITKVIFINTDTIPHSQESSTAETIQNSTECKIVCQILANLLSHGASSKQIGILSFYNSQLQIIKSEIPEFCNDLELLTIDKSQGRDKECIIVSFVRSNTEGNGGNLLQDWRRINVLLTRAKRKLVLVGSKSTLRNVPILDQLLSLLQDQSQICECIEGQG